MTAVLLDDDADPNYTHFAHREEFLGLLAGFLELEGVDHGGRIRDMVKAMGSILDAYLPLPGLLDPTLPEIVPPLMDKLAGQIVIIADEERPIPTSTDSTYLCALGRVINWVVKVRGWKAIVHHFPSDIHFLPLLVNVLSAPTSPSTSKTASTPHHPLLSGDDAWELRAVLLLWLALLLTVPFNLSALSDTDVVSSPFVDRPSQQRLFASPTAGLARQVVLLSVPLLFRPGKEGAYAAYVLARLYSREDAADGLAGFFDWADHELREGEREGEANFIASIFEFLAILPTLIRPERLGPLRAFHEDVLLPHLYGSKTATASGLIRKLAFKSTGRWWLAKLEAVNGSEELPEGLEDFLGDLMSGLGDKDTIVRYSAAKYLARIAATLPVDFRDQIVTGTLDLFGGTEEEPVVETPFGTIVDPGGSQAGGAMGFGGSESLRGESRWHGVCLALAELARRGLIPDDSIDQTVEWAMKALTFDIRRASHSVGANVRDAAAYLVWSLSRACPASSLESHAIGLATGLVCVACFDREVGVRRAASAAFQEGVGRLGIYPEGIDVLGKTDFYSVSVRRTAFTEAAVAVATLQDHLHNITLRHWDADMRILGAKALLSLVGQGTSDGLRNAIAKEIGMVTSVDTGSIHGALLALRELASHQGSHDEHRAIFEALSSLRPSVLVTSAAGEILEAACQVITQTLSEAVLAEPATMAQLEHITQTTMRRREPSCQEAVAEVFGRLSELQPGHTVTKRRAPLLCDLKSTRAAVRQSAALCLGHVRYVHCSETLAIVCEALLSQLDPALKADVETRRYAIRSLADLTCQADENDDLLVSATTFASVIQVLMDSLSDYSTDQRGDIGSWIRIQALQALGRTLSAPQTSGIISRPTLDEALGGIIKQSVEKLAPCRTEACRTLQHLRAKGIHWEGSHALDIGANVETDADIRNIDQRQWFDSAMTLLHTQYRTSMLAGIIISIGSSIESLSKTSLGALLDVLRDDSHLLSLVLDDLASILSANVNTSRVFLPALITTTKIAEAEIVPTGSAKIHASTLKIVTTASRGLGQIKSIERLTASLRLCVTFLFLSIPKVQAKALESIELLLAHRFPRIRAMTAEQLYLKLSEDDIESELEEALLETSWTDPEAANEAARVGDLLRAQLCL